MAKNSKEKNIPRHPDEITLDSGRIVRISNLDANAVIQIHGRNILVADIPLVVVNLKCGCMTKGIALTLNDIVFCEKHQDVSSVAEVLAK